MKLKKHIASLVSVVMIFGVCPTISFAEDSTKYAAVIDTAVVKNSNGTTVSLKINGLPKDSVYNSVCVLSADNDISDGISPEEISKAVYVSDNSKNTASNEYKFIMPDSAESGDYIIIAGGSSAKGDIENRKRIFRYIKEGDSHTYPISTITADDLSADDAPWYIDKTNSAYANKKSAVIAIMNGLAGESGFADARQVEEAFRISCKLLNSSDLDYELLAAYIAYRNSRGSSCGKRVNACGRQRGL